MAITGKKGEGGDISIHCCRSTSLPGSLSTAAKTVEKRRRVVFFPDLISDRWVGLRAYLQPLGGRAPLIKVHREQSIGTCPSPGCDPFRPIGLGVSAAFFRPSVGGADCPAAALGGALAYWRRRKGFVFPLLDFALESIGCTTYSVHLSVRWHRIHPSPRRDGKESAEKFLSQFLLRKSDELLFPNL